MVVVTAANVVITVYRPDLCDILTNGGMREMGCDYLLTRVSGGDKLGILLEMKSGKWSYSRVKKQFEGGLRMARALGVNITAPKFYVVAGTGPDDGSTRAIGGLQVVNGRPMIHTKGPINWQEITGVARSRSSSRPPTVDSMPAAVHESTD